MSEEKDEVQDEIVETPEPVILEVDNVIVNQSVED